MQGLIPLTSSLIDIYRVFICDRPVVDYLLGTHEKYLVCDRKFAMLGSHNLLTSSENNQEREVGILTTDIDIIQSLNDRFDNAESLEKREDELIDFDYFEREAMGYYAVGGGMSYEQYLNVFGY